MTENSNTKKNEALEIRVSHEEKQAFMDAVSIRGTTASTVLRREMNRFTIDGEASRSRLAIRFAASAIAMSVLALLMLGWQTISPIFSTPALANHYNSRIELVVVPSQDVGASHGIGRSVRLEPDQSRDIDLGTLNERTTAALFGTELPNGHSIVLSLHVTPTESENPYLYQFRIDEIDADGEFVETRWEPAIRGSRGAISRMSMNLGDQGLLRVLILPETRPV